jgi:ubiquinone/menaquinone biosynthesis C-methylase UbiE
MQNIWELKNSTLHRQKRRAQIVKKSLNKPTVKVILDIGCAEGYTTSFISGMNNTFVVGVELDIEYLKIAKSKVKDASFINASIQYLPFRDNCFDAVCILEVLEHLHSELLQTGLHESNRVLHSNGILLLSTPYKEKITYSRCIHCQRLTPLYGHINVLDEEKISGLLPSYFNLIEKYHMPNVGLLSCSNLLEPLPLKIWLSINNILGLKKKGYWIVLTYVKT